MNSEYEQAKVAMRALAEAKRSGKPIDLSSLPEPLRKKLQAQLEKLPPEMQKELLARGSPMVERAVDKVTHRSAVIPHYTGHYNKTVQAGDMVNLTIGRVLMVFGILAVAYYFWSQLGAPSS